MTTDWIEVAMRNGAKITMHSCDNGSRVSAVARWPGRGGNEIRVYSELSVEDVIDDLNTALREDAAEEMRKGEAMIYKPMLFRGEMVRAILEGRKTQTRRIVKPSVYQRAYVKKTWGSRVPTANEWNEMAAGANMALGIVQGNCPHPVGSRIWVKETWTEHDDEYGTPLVVYRAGGHRIIGATGPRAKPVYSSFDGTVGLFTPPEKWKSCMFMPRWASRLTLEVTAVRVQRVQDISEEDAKAEGVGFGFQCNAGWPDYQNIKDGVCTLTQDCARMSYASLWDSINRKTHPWSSNPWVWAYTFKREEMRKDGKA